MNALEYHKNTKKENIFHHDHFGDIIKVNPKSLSELKYYMDYGDGYDTEIYEKVLDTHKPVFFIMGEKIKLIYYFVKYRTFHWNEQLNSLDKIESICKITEDNPRDLIFNMIKTSFSINEEIIKKHDRFIFSNIYFYKGISVIANVTRIIRIIVDDILREIPNKNIEVIIFSPLYKWNVAHLNMFPNLKRAYGQINIWDGGEFIRRGGVVEDSPGLEELIYGGTT